MRVPFCLVTWLQKIQIPRRILKAWLSTILDSMSLLMPILTEQRTKIELKIGDKEFAVHSEVAAHTKDLQVLHL